MRKKNHQQKLDQKWPLFGQKHENLDAKHESLIKNWPPNFFFWVAAPLRPPPPPKAPGPITTIKKRVLSDFEEGGGQGG